MSADLPQMHTVFLGLGTNLGERQQNLQQAISGLSRRLQISAISPVYATPPWGVVDQPDFLNLCLQAETSLLPHELIRFLKELERRIGRTKTFRWGPRLIDIDILFYDDLVYEDEGLSIPHPRLAERSFVVGPLADIAPGLQHPLTGKRISELAAAVDLSEMKPAGFNLSLETEHE